MQSSSLEDVVSPGASFTSQRSTRSLAPAMAAIPQTAAMLESESQADIQPQSSAQTQLSTLTQFRTQTRSESHDGEAEVAAASEDAAAVVAGALSHEAGSEAAAEAGEGQGFSWGDATGSSELNAMGMTGRSASSRSTTRRRKVRKSNECNHRMQRCLT